MRILFVGDDWIGSNARSLANGFRQAGHDVVLIDSSTASVPPRLSPPWFYSKIKHRPPPQVTEKIHSQIEYLASTQKPDMLFCFKAIHLDQARLFETPAHHHVHYSPDDVSNPENLSPEYLKYEREWDLLVTTKRHNIAELNARGAKAVKFVMSAYDPDWHHLSARHGLNEFSVGFIGVYRPDRRDQIVRLAQRFGKRMAVWGPGWRRVVPLWRSGAMVGGAVYGENFSIAVASIHANLVFLNSANRDTHTCRTFEIPAAGGLFVGQRTDEHEALLEDKVECLMFANDEELAETLEWCETNHAKARGIAELGYQRIVSGNHRYVDRAGEIVDHIC